jgi:hypothetical protein
LSHFKALQDPRQFGKVVYPLDEILLLCLLAVLAGAETFVDIARFGERKIGLLRHFRPVRSGHAGARPPRRYLCDARSCGVPELLCCVGGGHDGSSGRNHCDRRQDAAALLPEERRLLLWFTCRMPSSFGVSKTHA